MKNFIAREIDIPEFIRKVIARLRTTGHQVYLVGGAVRDFCLQRAITDWDVATSAKPEEIISIFQDVRNFSLQHNTVTLVYSGHHYEVTSFKGTKNFGHTIEEDLGHRDFTINAMAYDEKARNILDPYGGREDILQGLVRAVGDPRERFREDALRLLRAVRLASELGFRIEPGTLSTISMLAEGLASVAGERIREELLKILVSPQPSRGFKLMMKTGLLREVLPELLEGCRKGQDCFQGYTIYKHIMETVDQVKRDPVLRLTALFHDIAKPRVRRKMGRECEFLRHEEASAKLAKEIMERLKFDRELIGKVKNLVSHQGSMAGYHGGWSDGALRRLIRRVGPKNIGHLLLLRRAHLSAHGLLEQKLEEVLELEKRLEGVRQRAFALCVQDLAIDGHKVMQITGLSEGPEVGRILKALLERTTDQPELNTQEGLTSLLKGMKDR